MPSLADRYAAAFPGSRTRFETARSLFPCGVTHDTRMMQPFPIFISRAQGCKKWDVDGHELIDYFVGHGSHILGHCPPAVVAAVQEQMARGTHPGASHDLEIEWATLVRELIPSAERVRFTGSGTEATMMALRLARIATGRPKFLKFLGHFHGWHDAVTIAADPPYDASGVPGVPDEVAANTVAIPPNDLNRVEETLQQDDRIGAVILEPTGGHWGAVPIRGEFLRGLRAITHRLDRVLIFDEVITGFRVSPGGAQAHYGVTPDLTALAKILAGGLPGGALVGRADILAYLEPRPGQPKMRHPGTYNGNPLSASAGIATLKQIATGEPCRRANEAARDLRNGLNAMFTQRKLPWIAYGDFSMIRIVRNDAATRGEPEQDFSGGFVPHEGDIHRLDGPRSLAMQSQMRQACLLEGIDWWVNGGMTSCVHSPDVIAQTVERLERAFTSLHNEIAGGEWTPGSSNTKRWQL